MNQKLSIILTFVFFSIFFYSCADNGIFKPQVVKGVIDLRSWDFQKEVVSLDGDWEFYPYEFIEPGSIDTRKENHPIFLPIPGFWNDVIKKGEGYGTYRIRMLLPEGLNIPLAFKVSENGTAYVMYANGKKISTNGRIGKTKETSSPQMLPLISESIQPEKEIEILFHVSNFHYRDGGLWYSLFLGQDSSIRQIREKKLYLTFFLCGSILIMAVYHLTIFFFRRKDKSPLFFSLFCFVIILNLLSSGERYLSYLYRDDPLFILSKIEYLCYYFGVPFFAHMLHLLFPEEFKKRVIKIIWSVTIPFSLVVIFTGSSFYTHTVFYFHGFTILCFIYFFYVILFGIIHKREGTWIILFGSLILILGCVNDILHSAEVIHTQFVVPQALLGFIFAQSVILSMRFSKAFNEVEKLTQNLTELNLGLEDTVIQRTIEYKTQKEIAESANKIKDKFVSIVSHDLRSPLLGVSNLLELLSRRDIISDEEERFKFISMCRDSIQHSLKMVRQLLDLSRIETGVVKVNLKKVKLRAFIDSILDELSPQGLIKNISFQCGIPESDTIQIDPELFSQVIRNLVTNAIKFSHNKGIIKIDFIQEDKDYILFIKDDGVGMSADNLKNLFDPEGVKSSLGTSGEQGSGMGLFICKYVVEAHNGKLHIESMEGVGTICKIRLPFLTNMGII